MGPHKPAKAPDLKTLKPAAKPYKIGVGGALYLLVMPNEAKYWRLKYRLGGKEKNLSLGVYPDVSLADAMEARDKAKLLLKDGIDPVQARRAEAKNSPKPAARKSSFLIDLSGRGELTIETETRLMRLTRSQTGALRSFLTATDHNKEGG